MLTWSQCGYEYNCGIARVKERSRIKWKRDCPLLPTRGHSKREHLRLQRMNRMRDVWNAERRGNIHATDLGVRLWAAHRGSRRRRRGRGWIGERRRGGIGGVWILPYFGRGARVAWHFDGGGWTFGRVASKAGDGAGGIRLLVEGGIWLGCDGPKSTPRNENGGVVWVAWSILLEILPYHLLEIGKDWVVDGQLPVQIGAHLPLHLVDLPQRKHALSDDAPGLVGICVITHHLGRNHIGRNK